MKPVADLAVRRIVNAVDKLAQVGLQVIKLVRRKQVYAQLIASVKHSAHRLIAAEAVVICLIPSELYKNIVVDTFSAYHLRHKTLPFNGLRNLRAHQFKDGRHKI